MSEIKLLANLIFFFMSQNLGYRKPNTANQIQYTLLRGSKLFFYEGRRDVIKKF